MRGSVATNEALLHVFCSRATAVLIFSERQHCWQSSLPVQLERKKLITAGPIEWHSTTTPLILCLALLVPSAVPVATCQASADVTLCSSQQASAPFAIPDLPHGSPTCTPC